MKNLHLLGLIFFLVASLWGREISSRIETTNKQPIKDALVWDGYKKVYSKPDGSFLISTNSDSLTISKVGYHKVRYEVQKLPNPVILAAKPIELSPVRISAVYTGSNAPALDVSTLYPDTDSKAASLAEVLLQGSAVVSTGTSIAGETQILSIMGNLSRHTLVILDGVALNPAGEAFDFSILPLERIERI